MTEWKLWHFQFVHQAASKSNQLFFSEVVQFQRKFTSGSFVKTLTEYIKFQFGWKELKIQWRRHKNAEEIKKKTIQYFGIIFLQKTNSVAPEEPKITVKLD